jgi:hypothetical protein
VHIPTLTYGAESWPLTTKHESRIITTEMKFVKRIVGKTIRDKWRNIRSGTNPKLCRKKYTLVWPCGKNAGL